MYSYTKHFDFHLIIKYNNNRVKVIKSNIYFYNKNCNNK